jgi:hypothetical protein
MADPKDGADPANGATVTAGDIARLADVGRAAVSNWRRRHSDFPQPVGGSSASPLYPLADVVRWLGEHGRPVRLGPADEIWTRARGVADDLRLGQIVGLVAAVVLLVCRDPGAWAELEPLEDDRLAAVLPERLATSLPELPAVESVDPAWVPVLRAAAGPHEDPSALVEALADRYREALSRRLSVTSAPSAALMVALAVRQGGTVLDPACGTGGLLVAALGSGAGILWGQDISGDEARLAGARLLLRAGAAQTARVAAGDSLRADAFAGALADAVVCDPPFSERSWGYDELSSDARWEYGLPPRGEPELAWLQHCLAHARPGGAVAILMPATVASRRAGRRIRGNLLRAGALRAVLSLPPAGQAAPAPDLWLLRRPVPGEDGPSELLLAEAVGEPERTVRMYEAFTAQRRDELPAHAASVRLIDLLDDEIDLSPARHLRPVAGSGNGYGEARERLAADVTELVTALPILAAGADARVWPTASVADLIKGGIVAAFTAPLGAEADTGDHLMLTASDVRAGRPASGRGTPGAGSVPLRPGDVVVPLAAREPAAVVVAEGDVLLGVSLLALRADPERLDPEYLAGVLRAAQSEGGQSILSGRADPRRFMVALPPLPQQRAAGRAHARLAEVEARVRQVTALASAVIRRGRLGLADGTLRPD